MPWRWRLKCWASGAEHVLAAAAVHAVAAPHDAVHHHPIAHRGISNARPHRVHDPRVLVSQRPLAKAVLVARGGGRAVVMQVAAADGRHHGADAHLARSGFGNLGAADLHAQVAWAAHTRHPGISGHRVISNLGPALLSCAVGREAPSEDDAHGERGGFSAYRPPRSVGRRARKHSGRVSTGGRAWRPGNRNRRSLYAGWPSCLVSRQDTSKEARPRRPGGGFDTGRTSTAGHRRLV